jgi:hypothetical protein
MNDWEFHVTKISLQDISNAELGKILRGAWSYSRYIPLPNYKEGAAFHAKLMGVRTRESLYRGTKCISVVVMQREIIIDASKQYGIGCYEPIPDTKMRLPESTADEAVGEAVRRALASSIG